MATARGAGGVVSAAPRAQASSAAAAMSEAGRRRMAGKLPGRQRLRNPPFADGGVSAMKTTERTERRRREGRSGWPHGHVLADETRVFRARERSDGMNAANAPPL